jgi:hypothetical protein
MTSLVNSIRRRILVTGLVVASLAGASGALASFESGSDYADPEVLQLGYGPGGPPAVEGIRTSVEAPQGPVVVRCDASDDRSYMDCGDASPSAGIPTSSGLPEAPTPTVPRCDAWEDASYMGCE